MRHPSFVAALIGLGLSFGITPVFATNQSAAVQMCAKNPSCGLARSKGGVNLWVDLPGGGTNEVWCPDQGECECMSCNAPQRLSGGAGGQPGRPADLGYMIRLHSTTAPPSLSDPAPAGAASAATPPAFSDGPALP